MGRLHVIAVGLFAWICSATAQPRILSGPVTDALTPTSARVTWITDVASTSVIHYGLTSAYGKINNGSGPTTTHSWYISGLKPATTYYYKVCSAAGASQTCSTGKTVTSAPGTAVAQPEAPRTVTTVLPSGPYGTPFLVDSNCSNLPAILSTVSNLTGSLHYEVRIPAENCVCRPVRLSSSSESYRMGDSANSSSGFGVCIPWYASDRTIDCSHGTLCH